MKKCRFILRISCLLLLVACSKKEEVLPVIPAVEIIAAYSVNESSALARGSLLTGKNTNADAYGIVWGQNPLPDVAGNTETIAFSGDGGQFTLPMEGLVLGQTYYIRSYVRKGEEVNYSESISFVHQGPFVWKQRNSVRWSDRQHTVSSIAWRTGIYVLRPVSSSRTEVWLYIPRRDEWLAQKDLFIPASRFDPLLFTLNKFGEEMAFFGGGYVINESLPEKYVYLKECFEYYPGSNAKKWDYFDFPFGYSRLSHFVIDDRAYVLAIDERRELAEFQWGVIWNKKKEFPGPFLGGYASFSIGDKGYVLVESIFSGTPTKEFYEYDPGTDTWTRKADFPGEDRINGTAFSVHGMGYYGAGQAKSTPKGLRDFWQYDSQTDTWKKFADYPGTGNVRMITSIVEGKVYIGLGYQVKPSLANVEEYKNAYDFWEFDPR